VNHDELPKDVARYRRQLLDLAEKVTEQELRWHFPQILPHDPLSLAERLRFAKVSDA